MVVAGENEPAAPAGSPETLSATDPLNPFSGDTLIVVGALLPWATVSDDGVADREKLGGGVTVSVTVVVRVRLPLVPVTVSA